MKLKDICNLGSGGTPSRTNPAFFTGNIFWVKISDIENAQAGIINDTEEKITEEALQSIGNRLFPKGTLLFAMYGSIGKVAIAGQALSTNQAILGIRPKKGDEIYIPYLKAWFERKKEELVKKGRGGILKNLNAKIVSELDIVLPPYPDQIRIATLLSRAEALIEKRRESLRLLDELVKGVFLEMFGGDISHNPHNFDVGTIRDLVSEVKYGTSKPAGEGTYKYLRMNNITFEGYWDFSSLKHIQLSDDEYEKYVIRKGDLVFNRTNSKELVGKTAVFDQEEEMIIAGYLIRVRVKKDVDPWFIWGFLNSYYGKRRLFNLCRNIVGMANINAQEFQEIPILKPPYPLQTQFAAIVERVETLKAKYAASLAELERLYGSLSGRAFRGELDLSGVEVDEELLKAEAAELPEPQAQQPLADVLQDWQKTLGGLRLDVQVPKGFLEAISKMGTSLQIFQEQWKELKTSFDPEVSRQWQEAIEKWAQQLRDGITFEQFMATEGFDGYETAKQEFFEFLKKEKPFLEQEFNPDRKQIIFRLNETD